MYIDIQNKFLTKLYNNKNYFQVWSLFPILTAFCITLTSNIATTTTTTSLDNIIPTATPTATSFDTTSEDRAKDRDGIHIIGKFLKFPC